MCVLTHTTLFLCMWSVSCITVTSKTIRCVHTLSLTTYIPAQLALVDRCLTQSKIWHVCNLKHLIYNNVHKTMEKHIKIPRNDQFCKDLCFTVIFSSTLGKTYVRLLSVAVQMSFWGYHSLVEPKRREEVLVWPLWLTLSEINTGKKLAVKHMERYN